MFLLFMQGERSNNNSGGGA